MAQPNFVSERKGKRIVYVEPEASGHHLAVYASAIWQRMIEEGWTICWLTSHHAVRSPTARELIARFGTALEVHAYPFLKIPDSGGKPIAWLRYQTHHWRLLKLALPRLVGKFPTNCVFLPWLDYCDRACGLFGLPEIGVPFAALHMHVSIHESLGASASLVRRASRSITERSIARLYTQTNLRKVAVIVENFATFAKTSKMPGWEKVVYVPDAGSIGELPEREASRARYSLREDEVAILCFGALTYRKGVEILLAAANSASGSSKIVVILAGKQDADIQAKIDRFQPAVSVRMVIRDAFVTAEEERSLFSASDLVWVGYPGFTGSSGVLIQAGCASLPVISGIQGDTGQAVRDGQCGIACDLSKADEVAAAVRELVLDSGLRTRLGRNGATRSEHHNPRLFAENVLNLIKEAAETPSVAS